MGAGDADRLDGVLHVVAVEEPPRHDAALDIGSTVEFEITLPPEMTGAKEGVVIQCRGRVVRTDEPDGGPTEARGVACVIDSYDFVRH